MSHGESMVASKNRFPKFNFVYFESMFHSAGWAIRLCWPYCYATT